MRYSLLRHLFGHVRKVTVSSPAGTTTDGPVSEGTSEEDVQLETRRRTAFAPGCSYANRSTSLPAEV